MKAIVCDQFAPVESLQYRDVEEPEPRSGEVRITIEAIGVNFPDGLLVEGSYQAKPELPFTPGVEFAGIVDAVAEGVTDYAIGDRVIGVSDHYSAYAEKVCCAVERLMAMPKTMPFSDAASLVLAHGTAHHALKQRGQLQPGETLLVLGAAGGTGLAAVQIGKAMGARVIAACSTDAKLALAKANGADELINYQTQELRGELKRLTDGKGIDVVYDPVGGAQFDTCARSMAPYGRLLVIGFASGEIPKLPVNLALVKEFSAVGVFWGAFVRRDPATFAANMQELFGWYEQDQVRLHIDQALPLSRAAEALRRVLDRQVNGKLVLVPDAVAQR